jgi:hypothetical protein
MSVDGAYDDDGFNAKYADDYFVLRESLTAFVSELEDGSAGYMQTLKVAEKIKEILEEVG